MKFHVEGLVENGEDVPEWLKNGDYEFVYNYLDATTLLKAYSPYVSLAAISRASGINQSLLSHYVNGLKKPREHQLPGLLILHSFLLTAASIAIWLYISNIIHCF